MAFSMKPAGGGFQGPSVNLTESGNEVVISNGIISLTILKPAGLVSCLQFAGLDNCFEARTAKPGARGYWDLNWCITGDTSRGSGFDVPSGEVFSVVHADSNFVEVSFMRPCDSSATSHGCPINIDKRFVVLRGNSGFYTYAIYDRPAGGPAFSMSQTRFTMKLRKDRFLYMAISHDRQKVMPTDADMAGSQQLGFHEAAVFTNPVNPELKGQVDDKFHYSCDNKDNRVHGWISTSPSIGMWTINASDEARNGGLTKQNLTSHMGPTSLSMFHSDHYAGNEVSLKLEPGEAWRKVFGPTFIYMNQAPPGIPPGNDTNKFLWNDASTQMLAEVAAWPYWFPQSEHYLKAPQRATVSGRLVVHDKFASPPEAPAKLAFVGLASPGKAGSWQMQSKGYQHWVQSADDGSFTIRNIIPGTYDLYAWASGVYGNYKRESAPLSLSGGQAVELGDLVWMPDRVGPTIWEIGVPDRTSACFFVPSPPPGCCNRLHFPNNWPHRFRQYGLWEEYSKAFPEQDLVYTVGSSDWRQDWWWAQVVRIKADGTVVATTWEIKFHLDEVITSGNYMFRFALASSNYAAIQLRINDPKKQRPYLDTMQLGSDNALARASCHGLYYEFNYICPHQYLRKGDNSFYLTQRKAPNALVAVMYDYLRLEAPPV